MKTEHVMSNWFIPQKQLIRSGYERESADEQRAKNVARGQDALAEMQLDIDDEENIPEGILEE